MERFFPKRIRRSKKARDLTENARRLLALREVAALFQENGSRSSGGQASDAIRVARRLD